MFANGPRDLGSIPGRVIPKTQKMVLDASLLNTQHYKVRIKGKVEQSWEGVAPSPTPWCSSYRKGSLRVTLDYGRQLYSYLLNVTFSWLKSRFTLAGEAQSTEAVEYTDCISTEQYSPPPASVLDTTLNNVMVRLQPWRFRKCGVPLHCHCSQIHSDPEW